MPVYHAMSATGSVSAGGRSSRYGNDLRTSPDARYIRGEREDVKRLLDQVRHIENGVANALLLACLSRQLFTRL
jgi:hypothetical protein